MPNHEPQVRIEERVVVVRIEGGPEFRVRAPQELRLVLGLQGPPGPPGAGVQRVDGGRFDGLTD